MIVSRKAPFVVHQGGKSHRELSLVRVGVTAADVITMKSTNPLSPTSITPPPAEPPSGAPTPPVPTPPEPPPVYGKALVIAAGPSYPYYVAGATAVAGVVGYALGGWLWALGGLVGGNLVTRYGAKYACDTGKADANECDYKAKWGIQYPWEMT